MIRQSMLAPLVVFVSFVLALSLTLFVYTQFAGAEETTAKETTAKETTAKETTAEETTAEETTAEETTDPETTDPETTDPETTDPETTDPREVSVYKEEPPDLYPEEKTVPEAGEDFPAYNQVLKSPSRKNLSRVGWKKKPARSGGYGKSYWQAKSGKAKTARRLQDQESPRPTFILFSRGGRGPLARRPRRSSGFGPPPGRSGARWTRPRTVVTGCRSASTR